MGKKQKGIKIEIGEICTKCKEGLMLHNELYTWKCNKCGYQYKIDPNAPRYMKDISEKFINEV